MIVVEEMTATSLANRRVLITGSAGGVGRCVARNMAEAGARVLLTDQQNSGLEPFACELKSKGFDVSVVVADLSDEEGIAQTYQQVDDRLGGLDVLVACAGVGSGPLMEMADADWRYVIQTNLLSYVACTRAAIDRMRKSERGDCSLILIGSISVHIKAVGESVYNAAKGGVASFAETLRKELMAERIRVTLIEPGAIGSSMQPFSPEERAELVRQHKLLPPEEVADAIMFAATRSAGTDVVTLRIEPQIQKIA
jgi:NAD(P)-dependent dehydrogenase (short-subunit alcohol dehydrogenase family)